MQIYLSNGVCCFKQAVTCYLTGLNCLEFYGQLHCNCHLWSNLSFKRNLRNLVSFFVRGSLNIGPETSQLFSWDFGSSQTMSLQLLCGWNPLTLAFTKESFTKCKKMFTFPFFARSIVCAADLRPLCPSQFGQISEFVTSPLFLFF